MAQVEDAGGSLPAGSASKAIHVPDADELMASISEFLNFGQGSTSPQSCFRESASFGGNNGSPSVTKHHGNGGHDDWPCGIPVPPLPPPSQQSSLLAPPIMRDLTIHPSSPPLAGNSAAMEDAISHPSSIADLNSTLKHPIPPPLPTRKDSLSSIPFPPQLDQFSSLQLANSSCPPRHTPATISRPPATISRPPATISRPPATISRPPATISRPPALEVVPKLGSTARSAVKPVPPPHPPPLSGNSSAEHTVSPPSSPAGLYSVVKHPIPPPLPARRDSLSSIGFPPQLDRLHSSQFIDSSCPPLHASAVLSRPPVPEVVPKPGCTSARSVVKPVLLPPSSHSSSVHSSTLPSKAPLPVAIPCTAMTTSSAPPPTPPPPLPPLPPPIPNLSQHLPCHTQSTTAPLDSPSSPPSLGNQTNICERHSDYKSQEESEEDTEIASPVEPSPDSALPFSSEKLSASTPDVTESSNNTPDSLSLAGRDRSKSWGRAQSEPGLISPPAAFVRNRSSSCSHLDSEKSSRSKDLCPLPEDAEWSDQDFDAPDSEFDIWTGSHTACRVSVYSLASAFTFLDQQGKQRQSYTDCTAITWHGHLCVCDHFSTLTYYWPMVK